MENIGDRIKIILKEKKLSIAEFSEQVGIQRSSLSHLFTGRNKPSIDLLLKIKKQFPGTDLEWLITGESLASPAKAKENTASTIEKKDENVVTNVTSSTQVDEYQDDNKIDSSKNDISKDTASPEKIVMFYKNGLFKEYNPES